MNETEREWKAVRKQRERVEKEEWKREDTECWGENWGERWERGSRERQIRGKRSTSPCVCGFGIAIMILVDWQAALAHAHTHSLRRLRPCWYKSFGKKRMLQSNEPWDSTTVQITMCVCEAARQYLGCWILCWRSVRRIREQQDETLYLALSLTLCVCVSNMYYTYVSWFYSSWEMVC